MAIVAYQDLLALPSRSLASPTPAQLERATQFSTDPTELLKHLERRFYQWPSFENLAWYGSVAEDVAYLRLTNNMRWLNPDVSSSPLNSPRDLAWLPEARAAWARMRVDLEKGWPPGRPWPRDGQLLLSPDWLDPEALRKLPVLKAGSWLRSDTSALFFAGQPLTKRMLTRRRGDGAQPSGGAEYVAEFSTRMGLSTSRPPMSFAGSGWRSLAVVHEFLKDQSEPPALTFQQSGQYGVNGLLGTVGASLRVPSSVHTYAVTLDGVVLARGMRLSGGGGPYCGPNEGVRISLDTPSRQLPLAYFSTPIPIADPALARVRLAATSASKVAGGNGQSTLPRREQRWEIDLDGDGILDLLVVASVGGDSLAMSEAYAKESAGALSSQVFANIGGRWKLVAWAEESGCT